MKIRHKLLAVLVATSALATLLAGLGAFKLLQAATSDRLVTRMRAESSLLADALAGASEPLDCQAFAEKAARRLGTRVTLISPQGVVVGDSAVPAARLHELENHGMRPEIVAARTLGHGTARRRSVSTGEDYVYVACAVDGGGAVRFVRLALPEREIDAFEARYVGLMLLTGLITVGVLTALSYSVVNRLTRPIERMSAAAERTAAGDLRLDVPHEGDDEVGRLADAVNRMKGSLLAKIDELDEERRLLGSVFGGMREGLLVVGPDRRVRLANEAFRQIFAQPFRPEGRLLAEVIRDPTVMEDLRAALEERREIRESVVRAADSGRSFELHVTPLEPRGAEQGGGALVLFFDVSRLEALEGVRREFVANVSHELRTPLTSIKAFVETLLDGGVDDQANAGRFLSIVRSHTDRMNELIDDLTDLSLIETGAVRLDIEEVDAAEVVLDVVAELGHKADKQGVTISAEVPSPFPLLADRRRLEQVLVNLVDNAIKFNRPGGRVTLRGSREDGLSVLEVEDTGAGIPADSLEKVFHRFYRVDKARSRAAGGTGLGLSIVKHLMRLHGGQVRLTSELGRGSTFRLEFPGSVAG